MRRIKIFSSLLVLLGLLAGCANAGLVEPGRQLSRQAKAVEADCGLHQQLHRQQQHLLAVYE